MKTPKEIELMVSELSLIRDDFQKQYYESVNDGDNQGSRFYSECRNEKHAQINALMWVLGFYKDIR